MFFLKRKFLLIILIILLLAIVILFVLSSGKKQTSVKPVIPTPTIFPTLTQIVFPSPSITLMPAKIIISQIPINNIYQNPVQTNVNKDVKFFQNDKYEFVYLPKFSQFIITITGSPYYSYVQAAENDFLKSLDITKEQACKLDVQLSTIQSINPNEAGKFYPLSFCRTK